MEVLFLKSEIQGEKIVTVNFWKLRNVVQTVRPWLKLYSLNERVAWS